MKKYLICTRRDQENLLKNHILIASKTCVLWFSIIDCTYILQKKFLLDKNTTGAIFFRNTSSVMQADLYGWTRQKD